MHYCDYISMGYETAVRGQGWGYARLDSGGPLRKDHLDGAESSEQKDWRTHRS